MEIQVEDPSFHSGRKAADVGLVRRLYRYALQSKGCHPLLRRYLLEVVLWDGNVGYDIEKQIRRVDYCLRNWEIRELYNPGRGFLEVLESYDIFDFLFPLDGVRRVLPGSARIPDEYKPKPAIKPGEEQADATDSDDEDGDFGINDQECRKNLGVYPLRTVSRTGTWLEPGSLDDYLRLLDEIPRKDRKGKTVPRGVPPLSEQMGDDWSIDSKYRGTRQPPIGTRLKTIVNFLCDDDVDRGFNWKRNFDDTVDYLHWLALGDKDGQLKKASVPVKRMFEDAVDKARTHLLFEKHHYDPTQLVIAHPPKVPTKTKRLDWLGDATNWPLPSRASSASKIKTSTPRAIYPRPLLDPPEGAVNKLPWNYTPAEAIERLSRLEQDEVQLWDPNAQAPGIFAGPNLSKLDAEAFDDIVSLDEAPGWTSIDPNTDENILPNGQVIDINNVEHWAQQRGAHRAGLQQILRLYSTLTDGNPRVNLYPFNRLMRAVLPNSAVILRNARRKADSWQWIAPRLVPDAMPLALETMPYTLALMKLLNTLKQNRTEEFTRFAMETVELNDQYSVGLPKNIINGGPFVWRRIPSGTIVLQDLLKQCRTAMKLLQIASDRAGRPLIANMLLHAREAIEGLHADGRIPARLRLEQEEKYINPDGRESPIYVSYEDIAWIKFLATDGKNKGYLRNKDSQSEYGEFGVEFENDQRYRLYHIFATRVKRVLDNRNPGGLFAFSEDPVSVVQLLQEINGAAEANAHDIYRYSFDAAEVCCFLDRMQRFTGLVKFQPSPIGYGMVQRAKVQCYPEHRVIWSARAASPVRVRPRYPDHISDWETAFNAQETMSAETGEKIWNFFLALGFRLGWTIWAGTEQLKKREKDTIKEFNIEKLGKVIEAFNKDADGRVGSNPLADVVMEVNWEDGRRLFTVPKPTFQEYQEKRADKLRKEAESKKEKDKGKGKEKEKDKSSSEAEIVITTPGATKIQKREEKALEWLRKKVIDEVAENLTMIGPGRETTYFDATTRTQKVVRKFDFNWDWAVSSQKQRKQYWTLNRWPIDSGYLSERDNHAVKTQVVHKKLLYNPLLADPVDKNVWSIPQAERITLDQDNVKFKPGPATYVHGDIKYRRRKIERDITRAANRAFGLDQQSRPRTWGQTLARINPFYNPPPETEYESDYSNDSDKLSLPPVRKEDIPRGWDLEAERWKILDREGVRISYSDEEDEANRLGGFDDDDDAVMKDAEIPQPRTDGNVQHVPSASTTRPAPADPGRQQRSDGAAAAAAADFRMSGALGGGEADEDSDVSRIPNI